jgi:D-alanyl-D-alanine carboxypeptidase/D-alanyl-D-alanine-endopeptidase (penicillin-binding protein 4)
MRSLLLACVFLQGIWCSGATSELPVGFREVLGRPEYKPSHWAFHFVDLATGETLYSLNAEKLMVPASVTKLFSTAAVLDEFGATNRFKTHVIQRGELGPGGVLRGELLLVASGDLTMGGRTDAAGGVAFKNVDHTYANWTECTEWTEPDPLAGLRALAKQISHAGIRSVQGAVLVDDRLFDSGSSSGSGPSRLSPILINDNVLDVRVTPTVLGQPALVEIRPAPSTWTLDAQVITSTNATPTIRIHQEGDGRVVVRGTILAGGQPVVRIVEVKDPREFARRLFVEALEREGVKAMDDRAVVADRSHATLPSREAVRAGTVVATLISPPLRDHLRLILKVSHNLHASTLPMLLAAQHNERTLEAGLRRQAEVLRRMGLAVESLSFGGGAGGTRSDYVTAKTTVDLLRLMVARPDFGDFYDALPILGKDGTLASISKEHPAAGHVRAKTGTLAWDNVLNDTTLLTSKALAGYITAKSGRRLAFAAFVNGVHHGRELKAKREGEALGRLCEVAWELH